MPRSACHHFHWINLTKPVPVRCWFAEGRHQSKEGEGTLMTLHAILRHLHSNFVSSHLFSFIYRLFVSTMRKQNLKKSPWNSLNTLMLPRGSLLCFSHTHNVYFLCVFSFYVCVWISLFAKTWHTHWPLSIFPNWNLCVCHRLDKLWLNLHHQQICICLCLSFVCNLAISNLFHVQSECCFKWDHRLYPLGKLTHGTIAMTFAFDINCPQAVKHTDTATQQNLNLTHGIA